MFSSDTTPSTADDEYDRPTEGAAPNPVGGTGTGYEYSNDPICNPTSHDAEALNGVAVNDPKSDENPFSRPYTDPPDPDARHPRPNPAVTTAVESVVTVVTVVVTVVDVVVVAVGVVDEDVVGVEVVAGVLVDDGLSVDGTLADVSAGEAGADPGLSGTAGTSVAAGSSRRTVASYDTSATAVTVRESRSFVAPLITSGVEHSGFFRSVSTHAG